MQGMTWGVTAAGVTGQRAIAQYWHLSTLQLIKELHLPHPPCGQEAHPDPCKETMQPLCTHGSALAQHLCTGGKCPGGRWASLAGLCKGTLDKALFLPRKTPCALRERSVSSWGTGQSCSRVSLLQCEHLGSWVMAEGC